MVADKTYCISTGDTQIYLSESPKEFIYVVDTLYLNTGLITHEDLDILVGYLAVTYPTVEIESTFGSSTFLKCVEVPKREYLQCQKLTKTGEGSYYSTLS